MAKVCDIKGCGCKMAVPNYNSFSVCAICDKSLSDASFLKVPFDHTPGVGNFHYNEPIYWINKQFYLELENDLVFCSSKHSLEYYEKLFDKNAKNK